MSNDKSNDTPGPVPLPPSNRRSSFSQNPSFQTLFGSNKGSPPRQTTGPDPNLQRRFSWSYAPPKESSAIDDTDEIATSPVEASGLGRRLSTTATSLREALGFKTDEPTSPRQMTNNPFGRKSTDASPGTSPTSSEGEFPRTTQSFMQRRRASLSKSRTEADPHQDRMLQGHFSID